MNAGGVLNTCKSYGSVLLVLISGARVSNTWITYPKVWDNVPKGALILNTPRYCKVVWKRRPLLASFRFRMGPRPIR